MEIKTIKNLQIIKFAKKFFLNKLNKGISCLLQRNRSINVAKDINVLNTVKYYEVIFT